MSIAATRTDLGGYHHGLAAPYDSLSHSWFRTIGTSRIDEIDAKTKGMLDHIHCVGFVVTRCHTEATVATATKPGHTHFKVATS